MASTRKNLPIFVAITMVCALSTGCGREFLKSYENRRKIERTLKPSNDARHIDPRYASDMGPTFDQKLYARVLGQAFTARGEINRKGLRGRSPELKKYLKTLAEAHPSEYRQYEWDVLMINAFNAFVLQLLVEAPTNAEPKDVRQLPVWREERFIFGGIDTSLSDIQATLFGSLHDEQVKHTLIYGTETYQFLRRAPYTAANFPEQMRAQKSATQGAAVEQYDPFKSLDEAYDRKLEEERKQKLKL